MYKMVNEAGNAHVIAKTDRMRDQFLARGFRIEEPKPADIKPAAPKKRKVAQKNEPNQN